jgi:hypothetical protein
MKGKGQIGFGVVGLGAVTVDLTLDNGQDWNFTGAIVGVAAGGGFSTPAQSCEFHDKELNHLEGWCTVGLITINPGAGLLSLGFMDTSAELGEITCLGAGVAVGVGAGMGKWVKGKR